MKKKKVPGAPAVRIGKEITVDEALGPQTRGVLLPEAVRAELEANSGIRGSLYQYRQDVLEKIAPGLGLQFVEDSPFPWISDRTVKLNLGDYKEFGTRGWINIGLPGEAKKQFNVPLEALARLEPQSVDFVYAPFVLERVQNPSQCLVALRVCLKDSGMIGAVVNDRDKLIREGRKFESSRFNLPELRRLLEDAGYTDLVEIGFRWFSLCGEDPAYSGFLAFR